MPIAVHRDRNAADRVVFMDHGEIIEQGLIDSHIVEGALPRRWGESYGKLRNLGMGLFFVLVALSWFGPTSGWLEHVIGPPIGWMLDRFETLAVWVAGATHR